MDKTASLSIESARGAGPGGDAASARLPLRRRADGVLPAGRQPGE